MIDYIDYIRIGFVFVLKGIVTREGGGPGIAKHKRWREPRLMMNVCVFQYKLQRPIRQNVLPTMRLHFVCNYFGVSGCVCVCCVINIVANRLQLKHFKVLHSIATIAYKSIC